MRRGRRRRPCVARPGAALSSAAERALAVPKSAALLRACALAAAPRDGGCAWCGHERPKGRRTWCSERCATRFWTNHWWSLARAAAKRRDRYRCVRCAHALPKRPTRANVTDAAYRAAMRVYRIARRVERLEVNHIVAARGAHGSLSCVHHLDNLETLCVPCHLAFTRASAPFTTRATNGASAPQ